MVGWVLVLLLTSRETQAKIDLSKNPTLYSSPTAPMDSMTDGICGCGSRRYRGTTVLRHFIKGLERSLILVSNWVLELFPQTQRDVRTVTIINSP